MPSARIVTTRIAASAITMIGLARQAIEHEAADHDQLAMGEVDQPHDAEDQADAQRRQGIDGAQADGVDGVLDARSWRARSAHGAEIGGIERRGALQLRRAAGHGRRRRSSAHRSGRRPSAPVPTLCSTIRTVTPLAAQFRDRVIDLLAPPAAPGRATARPAAAAAACASSARAIASICCSPPESLPARCRKRSRSTGKRSSTRSCRPLSPPGRDRVVAPRCDVLGHGQGAEDVPALRHQRQAAATSRSGAAPVDRCCRQIRCCPASARTMPAMVSSNVDLPAPLGPMTATISPSATCERHAAQRRRCCHS